MVRAEVSGAVDGDTVKVRIPNPPPGLEPTETIRLLGLDTPETVHPAKPVQYFGKEASAFTRASLLGKPVYLAFDWDLRDRYGRVLAYIYTAPGECFNARLIREGYAHAYTRFPFQFMDEFRALEQEARREQRGLWGSGP
jgi:micrococcal nuclease